MLGYFFLTVVLQENMKHQELKAGLCIEGKKTHLSACSRCAQLFPLKSVGIQL